MTIPASALPPMPPTPAAVLVSAPTPRGNWFVQLMRLTRWEIFLALRRRVMVIILSAILVASFAISYLVVWGLAATSVSNAQSGSILPSVLVFPGAAALASQLYTELGVLLFVILAGALIGSDFQYGVHRLSLTRGVGRGQLLTAQILALAFFALASSGLMLVLGAVVGWLGGLVSGGSLPLTSAGVSELFAYWLAIAFNAFCYALIAFAAATVGRSVAVGIGGPLVYIVVEVLVTEFLVIFQYAQNPTDFDLFLAALPTYFLGPNAGALIDLAGKAPYSLATGQATLDLAHALIVMAAYCAVLIAVAILVYRSRDVRE